ncbi:DUF2530 domain-containing protein [Arsenicicoccus dermatophilus]|uniref:DUF2530 domain-containing protein n=1 Tax=Arsenicicoccus dermatophilus TaxID=1076331 RepID=UPI001F4CB49A|nr:DUF2530 domain-containing protein [Arsenicicoccus dermatophilus]MCH8612064.1 DUF2530 domain-containing protein [Arsenicicoccus dermatophilus]
MARRPSIDATTLPVVRVRTDRVVVLGLWLWAVALVVILLVPGFHAQGRSWWPYVCVAGLAIGVVGYWYVRSGRARSRGA